jgi:twitching motility protein PilT
MSVPCADAIDHLLTILWDSGASDLILSVGSPPLIRIDGALRPLDGPALGPADTEHLIFAVLGERLKAEFQRAKEVDFSFSWRDKARLRGNAFLQKETIALALRAIPFAIPSLEALRMPQTVHDWCRKPKGFVLVTGATGSGKSTSLAAMIDRINSTRSLHILTVEDPIEYLHVHKQSAVHQREVGTDTDSFHNALRSALREDPDVVLVGEMRDTESISAALTIAETGHLVFATLHTNDTAQTLDRIVDVFPAEQQPQVRLQLAHTLLGILNQQLVPTIGGGRVAAFEVLVGTPAVRNLIREGKTRQLRNLVATGQRDGMQTLEACLSDLVGQGLVAYDDALLLTLHPEAIKRPMVPAYPNMAPTGYANRVPAASGPATQ